MVKSSTGSFVFKFFGSSKQTPPTPTPKINLLFLCPAMMPEDKDSDFDIHLQHSISALQSINNAMQYDVVVLYCSADIPSDSNPGIDPFKIREELKNWGFSVYEFYVHVIGCSDIFCDYMYQNILCFIKRTSSGC